MNNLIYCYDAYCTWCYGFSKVIKKLNSEYKNQFNFEVLSGGMILPDFPAPISIAAKFMEEEYERVEELTGIKFGEDFLWHIRHPAESDWFPNSEKPAIALCVFKDFYPDLQVSFATDVEHGLYFEGRDLTDSESYRHLLDKYNIPEVDFYKKLNAEEYKERARYEFALCKQLKVTGFPSLFIQTSETKFYMIAQGYTDYETLNERVQNVLSKAGEK